MLLVFGVTKVDVEMVTKFPLFFGFNRQRIKLRLLCFSTSVLSSEVKPCDSSTGVFL